MTHRIHRQFASVALTAIALTFFGASLAAAQGLPADLVGTWEFHNGSCDGSYQEDFTVDFLASGVVSDASSHWVSSGDEVIVYYDRLLPWISTTYRYPLSAFYGTLDSGRTGMEGIRGALTPGLETQDVCFTANRPTASDLTPAGSSPLYSLDAKTWSLVFTWADGFQESYDITVTYDQTLGNGSGTFTATNGHPLTTSGHFFTQMDAYGNQVVIFGFTNGRRLVFGGKVLVENGIFTMQGISLNAYTCSGSGSNPWIQCFPPSASNPNRLGNWIAQ